MLSMPRGDETLSRVTLLNLRNQYFPLCSLSSGVQMLFEACLRKAFRFKVLHFSLSIAPRVYLRKKQAGLSALVDIGVFE